MLNRSILETVFGLLIVAFATGQQTSEIPASLQQEAKVEIYKRTKDSKGDPVELKIYIYNPKNHQAADRRPAIVFFFGGGWKNGSPTQFHRHCQYLADRGMVAMTADYRVASRQGTKAIACVEDGKSAVRWIRENAKRLGVDPNKVAAGGGSAGGHVAATTGTIKSLDRPSEDKSVSSIPDAMVLFNPALVLAPIKGMKVSAQMEQKFKSLQARVGADPKSISPFHHVAKGAPPTIVFHGVADKTVPFATAKAFTDAMKKSGNRCELKGYEKQGHGFFNANRKNGKFKETVKQMDEFLVSLGFLQKEA